MEIELLDSPDMLDVSPKTETGLSVQAAREVTAAAPSVTVPSGPMANAIAFLQAGGTMETLERMMAMQKEHQAALAEQAYNTAFACFKAEAVRILKAKFVTDGPLRGKSYAELHDVVDAVTPPLSKNGLSTSWKITKDEPQWIEVTCTLKHVDGHCETVSMGGPPDTGGAKNAIQARASTVSYLQRYTLKAVCGVAEGGQDDDGNGGPNALDPKNPAPKGRSIVTGARSGIGDDLPEDWKIYLRDLAQEITSYVQAGDMAAVRDALRRDNLEADQRVYLENQMDSKVRSAIKKAA